MGKNLKGKELGVGFTQRQDGRYECKVTLNGKRRTFYDKKLSDLRKTVNDAKYESEHGICSSNREKLTLDDWHKIWRETYKVGHIKGSTLQKYDENYNVHIKDYLGEILLQDIKPTMVQNFINHLDKKGLATGTIKYIRAILSNIYEVAVQNDLLVKNPCQHLQIPKKPQKVKQALTQEEQSRFLQESKLHSSYYPIFFTALSTGMRVNEILALTWDDVNFKQGTISINKTLVVLNKKHAFQAPKTVSSKRVIPLKSELKTLLATQKINQNNFKTNHPERWKPLNLECFDNLIFTSKNGTPINYTDSNIGIKRIVDRINNTEKILSKEKKTERFMEYFSMHTLRHTFATRCFEEGIEPKIVQEILGHSNIAMTMDIYTHASKAIIKDAIEKIRVS
ncbi:tyrosine-type recombinase/integrase [Robinsoniella peoriensis]|uniref:tyrosine-type recombinase/integrase n=1 Tax=Robinsoniella peoriensis TaxID=180332 RepID=UPI002910F6F5|nr:site-specific integrase [Clostridiales bacterium]